MPLPESNHLLTRDEHGQLQALARSEGASAAAQWLRRRFALEAIDSRNLLAGLVPPVELAIDDPGLKQATERAAKRSLLAVPALLLAAALAGLLLVDDRTFVMLWWPACLLLLVGRWLSRPSPYGHPGLIMLGIVLIPVSGIVAVGLGRSGEAIPILGLPLLMLCLVCMAFGMAETLFAQRVPPGAPTPDRVVGQRRARRLARIVLASYLLAPLLAMNRLLADLGGIDEATFNSLFRYALFLIVAAPVTALFCVPLARSVGSALVALATPLVAAVGLLASAAEVGVSAVLAETAVVQLLAVYLTVIGGLGVRVLSSEGRRTLRRSGGMFLLLLVGLLLGLGVLELLGGVLLDAHPGRDLADWLVWVALPAALIAVAVIRRGDLPLAPTG